MRMEAGEADGGGDYDEIVTHGFALCCHKFLSTWGSLPQGRHETENRSQLLGLKF